MSPSGPPVERRTVFSAPGLEVRDNRCLRTDPALSPETDPIPFHEVCFPRRGLWIRRLAGRTLPVHAAHVHFFPSGEVHRVAHPGGCGDRNTGIVLSQEVLADVLADLVPRALESPGSPFRLTHAPLDARTFAAHRALLRCAAEEGPERGPLVEELALLLVERAIRAAGDWRTPRVDPATARRHEEIAERVELHIARRFAEPLTLGSIARAAGISRFHLCRVFRARCGTSVHRRLLELRLRAALERIAGGGEPLADIAAATGFADRTHLSREFARAFGVSPAAFRRRRGGDLARELLVS